LFKKIDWRFNMTRILHISASPRGAMSVTRKLGSDLVSQLKAANPRAEVLVRDLVTNPLPHVDGFVVDAMFTPPDKRSAHQQASITLSDALVDELIAADIVVMEIPMFNWSTPSAFKAWIDHVVRVGRTFLPGTPDHAYQPLLVDRPVYVVVASGGVYTHGPRGSEDFLTPYLRHVLSWVGLRDLRFVHAEGVMASADNALAVGKA
jgi:FMN-dependent NADH-azoreductase